MCLSQLSYCTENAAVFQAPSLCTLCGGSRFDILKDSSLWLGGRTRSLHFPSKGDTVRRHSIIALLVISGSAFTLAQRCAAMDAIPEDPATVARGATVTPSLPQNPPAPHPSAMAFAPTALPAHEAVLPSPRNPIRFMERPSTKPLLRNVVVRPRPRYHIMVSRWNGH